jgi:hypothetical protein
LSLKKEELKKQNGESGKDIKDAEKTKQSIFEKYGAKALMFALIVGGIIGALVGLKEMADSMSGCYQLLTCSDSKSSPVKVLCTNATVPNQQFTQCSCSGVKATGCASPACDGKGCPQYYWQTISPTQALASMPGLIAGGILNPITNTASTLMKDIAIYGGIIIVVILVAIVVFKLTTKYINNGK